MIKGQLVMALDFGRRKPKKGQENTPQHGKESYRNEDGQWFVNSFGPTYSNTHKVLEFDEAGIAWLLAHERKEEPKT